MSSEIEKFIWDLTYACPLRCIHCYSESGRRDARALGRDDAMRVVDVILSAAPERVSISGGEPLVVPWCVNAARLMHESGVTVTLFTSGWVMSVDLADQLADSVSSVAVSVDGPDPKVHDSVRGRQGSFDRAMLALEMLHRVKAERARSGRRCYSLGIDYTVTRSGFGLESSRRFVSAVTAACPSLDSLRFGAVIPVGLAAERGFEATELLTVEESVALLDSCDQLQASVCNGAKVLITDVRYFLPNADGVTSVKTAQIEADGAMRAFPIYEAKVGNVLHEPLDVLWTRALAWRADAFVAAQMQSIRTMADWAQVTRTLDARYGSTDDRERIAHRNQRPRSASGMPS